ncbi:Dr1-associated corepressor [Trichoplax sp. H2]|nr:Dr1-associated corepressor [Trichoplax sp. H2]|eukprot:RDD38424.1 Dr1-associated corepressor [Trichoplax sp. H2]
MPPKKKSGSHFSSAKIKRMMQSNEDIPKIANSVPVLIAKALDMMARDLLESCTEGFSVRMLTASHVKQCVESYTKFHFGQKFVANVPSLASDNGNVDANKSRKSFTIRKAPTTTAKKISANSQENTKKRKLPSQQSSQGEYQQPKKRGRPRKEKNFPNYTDGSEVDDWPVADSKQAETFAKPTAKPKIHISRKEKTDEFPVALNERKVEDDDDYDAEEEPLHMVLPGLTSNTGYDEDDDYDC